MEREAEILRRRAIEFLKTAEFLFSQKSFDLVAFHLEQFCQLYLKYVLLRKVGDFPKTHSIWELASLLKKVGGEAAEKFCKSNASTVGGLERAYITSRYIPIEFKEEEVKEMLDFCRKLKELVNGI